MVVVGQVRGGKEAVKEMVAWITGLGLRLKGNWYSVPMRDRGIKVQITSDYINIKSGLSSYHISMDGNFSFVGDYSEFHQDVPRNIGDSLMVTQVHSQYINKNGGWMTVREYLLKRRDRGMETPNSFLNSFGCL